MAFEIYLDIDDVLDELNRLEHPNWKAFAFLENVFADAYADSQMAVHIITGSLKNSGDAKTHATADDWQGTISYGGKSPGAPFNPVLYAFYEWRRGGTHNFFKTVESSFTEERFINAIIDGHFKGGV